MNLIGHRMPHDRREIELTVAVRVGARKLEEGTCRRIQLMRLSRGRSGAGRFETELEPQLTQLREHSPQSLRSCAAATQPFGGALGSCGLLARVESHDEGVPPGLPG